MRNRSRRVLLALLVPLAVVPLLVAATHGSRRLTVLSCGGTITASTTLAADLGPCGGNGVVVNADHVTLNLNGHQIAGTGPVGVFSSRASVTVENGRITGFGNGVELQGDANRVMNLRVGNASTHGILVTGKNDLVSGTRAFGNGADGIIGNGAASQYTNNVLQGNGLDGLVVSSGASISGNKSLSNGGDGILFDSTLTVAVTNNLANGNQEDGIRQATADPTPATMSGNKAYFNKLLGIVGLPGVSDGGNNKADKNGTNTQCTNIVCS